MTNPEWLDDHVELYAIDGLPDDEAREVLTQLSLLPDTTRAEYEALIVDIRDLMHEYAQQYTRDAPEELRVRVLADFDARNGGHPGHLRSTDGPGGRHRERRRHRVAVAVGAAAASVAVLFGAGVLVGRTTAPETSTDVQADAAAAVFSAPDAAVSVGDLDDSRGVLTVVSSRERNRAVAAVRQVRNPVPADRVLQLWMVGKRTHPVSAGLFESAADPIVVDALDSTKALAVTVEPRGGSAAPTTPLLTRVEV
ncbi:anti-sigma factor [Gordonia humi]|uniref:Regulator of SigK n=1 Tax=Gordonia humi TaxID=686429 RepID=A0A840EY61_9ACTN|nr:anti-sigma factor [Gordonia humi]MBB4135223.1 anti-sigma-K factor RskA [Gordonia humi]